MRDARFLLLESCGFVKSILIEWMQDLWEKKVYIKRRKGMRLLLVEDEIELSDAIAAILKHSHYSVDQVFDGEAALDYLETGAYEGVILDIMMPKVDGITVLKRLREKGNAVPVLILTAKSEIDDKVIGLDAGADDYLVKPFITKEFLARVRAITRRQSERSETILKFGNVVLNRASFELSTEAGNYRLANKEFQMMEMLMLHPQNLISSEHFMEKIWGYDAEAEINVVWVYISYLRKKLGAIKANIQIKASRNLGYSLEEDK